MIVWMQKQSKDIKGNLQSKVNNRSSCCEISLLFFGSLPSLGYNLRIHPSRANLPTNRAMSMQDLALSNWGVWDVGGWWVSNISDMPAKSHSHERVVMIHTS